MAQIGGPFTLNAFSSAIPIKISAWFETATPRALGQSLKKIFNFRMLIKGTRYLGGSLGANAKTRNLVFCGGIKPIFFLCNVCPTPSNTEGAYQRVFNTRTERLTITSGEILWYSKQRV